MLYKMYLDGKEDRFVDLGNGRFKGKIWSPGENNLNPRKVLEKSLKFVSEKGHAPCYLCVWTYVTTDERALGTLSMVVCGVKPGCARKRGHEAKRKQESLFVAKKAAVSGLVVVVTLLVWGF